MSYDQKCYDLAQEFLGDCEIKNQKCQDVAADEIAQAIQTAIEDTISDLFDRNIIAAKP